MRIKLQKYRQDRFGHDRQEDNFETYFYDYANYVQLQWKVCYITCVILVRISWIWREIN